MNQVEVNDVEAKQVKAFLERSNRRVGALIGVPQLGGDEKIVASETGCCNRATHTSFIFVDGGGVDVAVANLESFLDGGLSLIVFDLPDAKAHLRNNDAVIEGNFSSGAVLIRCSHDDTVLSEGRFQAYARGSNKA